MVKGLGGNPVVIPPTEVYVALERNVVDGYCWPVVGIRDWGWQKQTQYVVDPGFYNVPNPLLINLKVWNQLPQGLRHLLTEAALESEKGCKNRNIGPFGKLCLSLLFLLIGS
jgi:TRAP-type C4-dicarboxylate transport system substrate-binding protein